MSSRASWIFVGVLSIHGALVLISAFKIPLKLHDLAQTPIDVYRDMSGAGNTYGFFAPGVAPQWRVRAVMINAKGERREVDLAPTSSGEAGHRFGVLTSLFQEASEPNRLTLARSWAAWLLSQYPDATSVTILVDAFNVPSIRDYGLGERGGWEEIFRARIEVNEEEGFDVH